MSGVGWARVRRLASVTSTNAVTLEAARHGAAAGLVVVADHQTAGRGRLGRRWEAPPGSSLLVSVLLRPELPPSELHLCTAAVAFAAADACATAAGVAPGLKWPNDLVVGDRKLAGVLAEVAFAPPTSAGAHAGAPEGTAAPAVVVGIGLNVDWPGPPEVGGTCLRDEAGRPVDREGVLAALLEALGGRAAALDRSDGRRALAEELRRRCVTLGRRVRVELPGTGAGAPPEVLVGEAVALTDAGHLVVAAGGTRREVAAADVVHLRDAPAGPGDPEEVG